MFASGRRGRASCEIRYQFAALQLRSALARYARVSRKAGFRRDQPRWPKGTEQGGMWSGGSGVGPQSSQSAAAPRSRGHHFIPGEIYRTEPFKAETRNVFEKAVTGPLHGQQHGNSKEHVAYTKAVQEAFEQFKARNGILQSEDVTPDHAKKFINEIHNSSDPRIRNFNLKIYMREFRFYLRRIPRRIE